MIIDTFFFRTTAMVPHPHKVVVMLEDSVLAVHPRKLQTDTTSGIIDYTASLQSRASQVRFLLLSLPLF